MTILWIILTMMTSAAAVLVAVPFLRRMDDRNASRERELEIYRDQLREVEREAGAGLIEADQAEAAAQEIKRRLLAADQSANEGAAPLSPMHRQYAVIGLAGFVVMGSTILYSVTGRPDLPSATPGSRMMAQEMTTAPQMRAEVDAGPSQVMPPVQNQGGSKGLGSVDDMIARVLARVQANPDDSDSWRMLGWSYAATERYQQAADAYAKAAKLKPEIASLHSSYGEMLVRATGGINDTAKAEFETALKLDAKDVRGRFFKGVMLTESGDKTAALELWIGLLNDATPTDDWATELRKRIVELSGELKVDVAARLPKETAAAEEQPQPLAPLKPLVTPQGQPTTTQATEQPQPSKGPTAADISNAEAMTPEARQAMISSMVQQLADRLEKSPRDGDGWIKLIRSRKMLGDAEAAKAALGKALQTFNDIPQEQERIRAAAAELGVTQ